MAKDLKKRRVKAKPKLTGNQEEILKYYLDGCTPKQIAQIQGLDKPNSISNILAKLRKRGYLTNAITKKELFQRQLGRNKHLRLHAESFRIKILSASDKYYRILKKKNQDKRDNNTIELYKDKLVIYSQKDLFGSTVDECFKLSSLYWNRFLRLLENDYGILLIKPRSTQIYKFRQHIADLRHPSKDLPMQLGEQFKVYDENGEIRLLVDNSFIPEFEAVHNKYCKKDMQIIQDDFKDLITKPSLKRSELTLIASENTKSINRLAAQIEIMNNNLNKFIEHSIKKTENINNEIKQLKQIQETQVLVTNNIIQIITPTLREVKEDKHEYGRYFH